jgi:hypothetical protein
MSALEQEILDKFHQLDVEAQKRVRTIIDQETAVQAQRSNPDEWLQNARALRAEMRAKYGKLAFSIAEVIADVREERLNDLINRDR